MRTVATPEDLLAYWFGGPLQSVADEAAAARRQQALWWGKSTSTDEELRERFGATLAAAERGDLDAWAEDARGRLALILLWDQLPRSLYRDRPEAFAHDARARTLAREAIESGMAARLRPLERTFLYLPLEHAEDLDHQELSVRLYGELAAAAPPELGKTFAEYLSFAIRHRDIIARFGRFPHRNRILGRVSTAEESEFLKQPDSAF